jgi:purine-cytosine permease-like protein
MGYWPSKIACLLNIILMVGYCTSDSIIGGQMLSAVSDSNMSIVVGIIIVSVVSWVVAVFGLAVFHVYERYTPLLIPIPPTSFRHFLTTYLSDGPGFPN